MKLKRNKRLYLFILFPVLLLLGIFFMPSSHRKAQRFIHKDSLNEVQYIWSGALQSTSGTVVAKVSRPSSLCQLQVSTSSSFSNSRFSVPFEASESNNLMVKMKINGLVPGTKYFYAVRSDGQTDSSPEDTGSFTTPETGPFSFKFTVGSCSGYGNHKVYESIKNKLPLFHLTTGDLHYMNPNSWNNINVHREPYENVILAPAPSASLFKSTAMAYIWDDHDFSGDNSDGNAAGKKNARLAYQEYVPHYSLAAGNGNVAVYQAFTIGRVHFILSDLRSERGHDRIMSEDQKQWFKKQCLYARDNNLIIAWVSGISFGGTRQDNWGGFSAERTELSNFFRDSQIRNMFILSGDAHMVAIDDGSHHDFSSGKKNPYRYPVFQAAALNRRGSVKGGTYSEGVFPNPDNETGQFGLVEVDDHGGESLTMTFTGFRTRGNSSDEKELVRYSFTRKLVRDASHMFHAELIQEQQKIQLSWHLPDPIAPWSLERSDDNEMFMPLKTVNKASGILIDSASHPGWNYYSLSAKGHPILTERVFLPGISVAISPHSKPGTVQAIIRNFTGKKSGVYTIYNPEMETIGAGKLHLEEGNNTILLPLNASNADTCYVLVSVHDIRVMEQMVPER